MRPGVSRLRERAIEVVRWTAVACNVQELKSKNWARVCTAARDINDHVTIVVMKAPRTLPPSPSHENESSSKGPPHE